ERTDHEDVAVGEIDHPDDAVDHRVADRDQAVDRPEGQPVDELLEKIFHVPIILPRNPRSEGCSMRTRPHVGRTYPPDGDVPRPEGSKFFKVITAVPAGGLRLSPGGGKRVCIAPARAYAQSHAIRARAAVVSSLRRSAGRSGARFH